MKIEPTNGRGCEGIDVGVVYPITDSKWAGSIKCMTKRENITLVPNEKNEVIHLSPVTKCRVCMD